MNLKPIIPCLWFDMEAEEAANFYVSIFPNSSVGSISRYGKEGCECNQIPEGTALVVSFNLNGQAYSALNGGPQFKFTEAISLQVFCDNQEEIDYFWNKLTADGGEESMCGWLKDKYGLSWQIIPSVLGALMTNPATAEKVSSALMKMKKIDIAALTEA